MCGAALFFSCLGGTVSLVVAERERRTLRRLLVSPLHPVAYFPGLALSVIAFGKAVIVYTLAYAMGACYHGRTGTTILLTTHHLDEAEHLCSHIEIMKNGRIAKEGTVAALLTVVPAQAIALVETANEDAVRRRAGELGWGIRHYAGKIGCLLPQQVSLRAVVDALQDIDVSSVSVQRVSLEHAYLEVVQLEKQLL
jgi:hypothetical protein